MSKFPEWSPELEWDLYGRNAMASSKQEGSRAVYDRLRELSKGEPGSVSLEIPDAEIAKSDLAPGISCIRVLQNPLLGFSAEMIFFVKDEWIKEQ